MFGKAGTAEPAPAEAPSPSSQARPERAAWDLQPGATIGEGRSALKPLGGGSLYEVYLVWDEPLHAICAAKLVRPDQVGDDHALRELREEAEVLDLLAHPVIVRGFDAVLEGPHPHLLLEHLEGPSLHRLIRRGGPLPLQQLIPLALSLAGALHYMDRMGIVHLDVKPDNIIMGVPPRLLDLSIARSHEQARKLRSPIGTDAYMSPEQCDPQSFAGAAGPASDVWGLGATLHHALSGSRPYPRAKGARDSEDPNARFPQLIDEPLPLPDHVPEQLRVLVWEMLDPDPVRRPTAAQVAARLEPLVAELPRKMTLSKRGSQVW